MTSSGDGAGVDYAWFVGAAFSGGVDDQTERFIRDGVWEQGYSRRYIEEVKSIRSGDRIALKATYTRKHGLPFDNRGHFVSVMAIKATGIVADNPGDGRRLLVEWTRVDPPREWYFFTNIRTLRKVVSAKKWGDELLRFTFENEPQDIDGFRNRPFWSDRFGDQLDLSDSPNVNEGEGREEYGPGLSDTVQVVAQEPDSPYSVKDIIADGSFLEAARLETMLERLRDKKNLILQGPPGTDQDRPRRGFGPALSQRRRGARTGWGRRRAVVESISERDPNTGDDRSNQRRGPADAGGGQARLPAEAADGGPGSGPPVLTGSGRR